ncbi:MAG: helix-turn-helix domain-containing protein [Candidatus Eremiobacteraeota bacterium]|nr:helix-turn-helix domain-containing protein [Candidatus Eremiobacteraeota bacterium]
MEEKNTEFTHKTKGESVTFKTKGLVCKCGYKTVARSQMNTYNITMADAYRKKHNLLTTKEILGFRHSLDMSQQQFADLLGVHVQTIKRWEHGVIQEKAMDKLVRLTMKEVREKSDFDLWNEKYLDFRELSHCNVLEGYYAIIPAA